MAANTAERRNGTCNGCGLCCTSAAFQVTQEQARRFNANLPVLLTVTPGADPDHDDWMQARGFKSPMILRRPGISLRNGDTYVIRFAHRCPHLTQENQCDLHDSPAKPKVCADFPQASWELGLMTGQAQERCGFSFIRTNPRS